MLFITVDKPSNLLIRAFENTKLDSYGNYIQ